MHSSTINSFHSSPASCVCLPFSPSPSSLNPFTPMSPFHTSFRHSEKDQIRPENSGLFVQEGLYYETGCSWMLRDSVFLPWSESLRTWFAQKNLSSLSSWWWKYQFSTISSYSSNIVSHCFKNIHTYTHTHTHTHTHTYTHVSIYTFENTVQKGIFFI